MQKIMHIFSSCLIVFFLCLAFMNCSFFEHRQESAWKPGIPLSNDKIKIAFIHLNDINRNSFYENAHYQGSLEMQQYIGLEDKQIVHKVNVFDGDPGVVEGVMRDCIAEGCNIIIATSFGFMGVCEKLAAEFPTIIFVQLMGNKRNNRNFTYYTARLYHACYLAGIAAGLRTESGKIGYVAAIGKENSEVSAGINAFAIGVEEVNPNAHVYVHITYSWYDPMGEADATSALIAAGCDVIAAHCDTSTPQTEAQKAGVWAIGFNGDMSDIAPDAVITSVIPHWGSIYTRLIESIIKGTFRAAPYYYGLGEEAVDITPLNLKLAAPGTEDAVGAARRRIINGGFNVFDGKMETNTGAYVGESGGTLSDEIILGGIDWYYRNVVEQ